MKAATLFSGIGAPEQAMPRWQWLWHAEIEPFPAAVMAARHPGSINLGDVSAHDFAERAERAGRPDVLVFGSPCQSFSVAGKRLGLADPRGNLALVALALVARLRPSWFVFENVPGLLSSERGGDFAAFLGAVAECGYSACWRVLDAQHWGLAQRRERVFVVGCLGDWRGPAAILSLAEGLRGYPETRREAGEGVAATLTQGAESRGRGGYAGRRREDDVNLVPQAFNWQSGGDCRGLEPSDITMALQCEQTPAVLAHTLRAEGFDASEDGTGRGTPLVPVAMNLRGREGGAMPEMAELASLRAASGGSSRSYVAHTAVRRLTPRECERLQGFPDDFTLIDWRGKPAADGPRYRALGNSMAVPVLRWILSRIEAQSRAMELAA